MTENTKIDQGNLLAGFLEDFKLLEKELPEVAQKLGFAGFVQYSTMSVFSNEQYELLERITNNLDSIHKILSDR